MRQKQKTLLYSILLATGFFLMACQSVRAFALIPMAMDFKPSGRGANRTFRVENDSAETIAVQVSMKTREMAPDGKETHRDAEDDFIVYPSQIVLKPKGVQAVRVKWIGNAKPDRELAYRIVAEQLPVNLSKQPEEGVKINILTRYVGSVYIVPKGVKPDVVLELVEPRNGEDGKRQLRVRFHNRGTRHVLLRDLKLQVKSGGKVVEVGRESLQGLADENVLAGGRRELAVPWPSGLPDGPVEASFTYSLPEQ